jgi:hypothetical protein
LPCSAFAIYCRNELHLVCGRFVYLVHLPVQDEAPIPVRMEVEPLVESVPMYSLFESVPMYSNSSKMCSNRPLEADRPLDT